MYHSNTGGTVTMQISGSSAQHQRLITAANTDKITRSITGPIVIYDGNTRELITLNKSRIITIPDINKASGVSTFAWAWHYDAALQQPFGFNNNVVGQ